jgi:hypothetical protein
MVRERMCDERRDVACLPALMHRSYPGSDSVVIPQASFDDHQGVYFHTQIGAHLGHCPATVGQD